MTRLARIAKHKRTLGSRTVISVIMYSGFFVSNTIAALDHLVLDDPVTLVSLASLVAAFLILPRDYVPAHLSKFAESDEEFEGLEELEKIQKAGFFIRLIFIAGAIITVLILPQLVP
jgi:hypothetical protein